MSVLAVKITQAGYSEGDQKIKDIHFEVEKGQLIYTSVFLVSFMAAVSTIVEVFLY
ncbi:hypothetical protein [Metabacillus arenae]|uniref:Uncharacterized protein n=1 Tax=Metabacillus arenae TaxID=2771434 RepID=A0A926RXJ1_9BACI|nr:hypothetical protein [Metabacillus arenae]MBD1380192.1 hypothetical protein [Metabacillus arenae]